MSDFPYAPVLAIFVFLIAVNLFMMARAGRKKASRETAPGRQGSSGSSTQNALRGRADAVHLEIEEFWRLVSARTDDKTRVLERLILDADRRIEELRELAREDK